jgi:hypothetical protein
LPRSGYPGWQISRTTFTPQGLRNGDAAQRNLSGLTGLAVVVTLPDRRLIAIQSLEAAEDDSLVDDLLESSPEFLNFLVKSKASARKSFPPAR